MPIPLPNLDDWTYADLTAEARALIPSLCPEWTNHNPSDPGITLIELLAWLTEMLLFQVNEIPPTSTEKFLELLNGPDWAMPGGVSLDVAIRQTILGLRERYRAATPDDYEWLALNAWPQTPEAGQLPSGGKLARVHCVPRRDLSAADLAARRAEAPAHVSLVVLPEPPPPPGKPGDGASASDGLSPQDRETALHDTLWQFLEERRILTTRHHVVGPSYLRVEISADLALYSDAPPDKTLAEAHQALVAYYDPLTGGADQEGWPFGRAVYISEASGVLERVPLVDYVENVQITAPDEPDRTQRDSSSQAVAVGLDANELVSLQATSLVAYDMRGQRYEEA
jgi:hypothetical protein